MHRRSHGFSLIELLIVVAVIGVITTIAIPNLLGALHRGRQKRTMGDLRTLATAVESYASDNDVYPEQVAIGSVVALQPILQPSFTLVLHLVDGWNRDFQYVSNASLTEYTILSYGKDGLASGPASGPTTNFNDDIIYSGGVFVAFPQGIQK